MRISVGCNLLKKQQQQKSTPDSSGRFQHETVIAFLRRLRNFLGNSLRMLIEIKFLSVRERVFVLIQMLGFVGSDQDLGIEER